MTTLAKIYTRTGDHGETGLFGGPRVSKTDPRIDAYGQVDELNAVVGWVAAEWREASGQMDPGKSDDLAAVLQRIQSDLFAIGAELATPDPRAHNTLLVQHDHIEWLERTIDAFDAPLPPLQAFILPGGSRAAAALHIARTVCRRAERAVVGLAEQGELDPESRAAVYLNRLSDLFFVLARWTNHMTGAAETPWRPGTAPSGDEAPT